MLSNLNSYSYQPKKKIPSLAHSLNVSNTEIQKKIQPLQEQTPNGIVPEKNSNKFGISSNDNHLNVKKSTTFIEKMNKLLD